jgi:steroid 5-alpha reductase family enzyme
MAEALSAPTTLLQVALAGLTLIASLGLLVWLASLVRSDVSLVDRFWPVFIAGAALVYFTLLPTPGLRGLCMAALAIGWALRLGLFITLRNWGHGEDRRYREIRARNQPNFGLKSLYLIFALQVLLAWAVSAPFLAGMAGGRPLGPLDGAGIALAVFGIVFEAIGDAQMARFRADPAHHGQVMARGLWRFTRHPNYFGEACVWWGLWLMALAAAPGWAGTWSVISPALMTLLLLKVSGVRLLEKDIAERRPAYRDYIARTPAFVPGLPRKNPR